ncbi:hypothetical protein AB3662_04195 [Sorangium cellulosum]|uniref:hypothetical protein n=1 Tax=Sorangium cellulosum TaxID=56 RepID=UPI003D9A46D1
MDTDGCSVFARASAVSAGSGTREHPYASLQEAIDHAAGEMEGRTVCACAGKAFTEAVTLRAGIEVRGDYTCDGEWKRSPGTKSTIEGPPGQVALTLTEAAAGAKVQGFEIRAASATEPGGSSIAVAVANVAATLKQVKAVARDAMAGANGETPAGMATAGEDALAGDAANACVDAPKGGKPGVTTCGAVDASGGAGGPGGTPTAVDGTRGADGKPMFEAMRTGKGGLVDQGLGQIGLPGAPGGPGQSGSGGGKDARLTLTGILGGDGAPGGAGKPGQGGGGGGGSNVLDFCPALGGLPVIGTGASGGGGGAGGCGGAGGAGGRAGGSSIGIVSLGKELILVEVGVEVGKGGNGGNGTAGQPGGSGGRGAAGGVCTVDPDVAYAGAGGDGGDGGRGGPGGGGRGGYAIGIAYVTAPDAIPSFSPSTHGRAGVGGLDGRGFSAEAGQPGGAAKCWRFDRNESCAQ